MHPRPGPLICPQGGTLVSPTLHLVHARRPALFACDALEYNHATINWASITPYSTGCGEMLSCYWRHELRPTRTSWASINSGCQPLSLAAAAKDTFFLVREDWAQHVSLWKFMLDICAIWVRFQGHLFGLTWDVYMAAVYLPPAGSVQLHTLCLHLWLAWRLPSNKLSSLGMYFWLEISMERLEISRMSIRSPLHGFNINCKRLTCLWIERAWCTS